MSKHKGSNPDTILFTPFTFKFPREKFEREFEDNRAHWDDFTQAETLQGKMNIIWCYVISLESLLANMTGFWEDLDYQMECMESAVKSYCGAQLMAKRKLKDLNDMVMSLAKYQMFKIEKAKAGKK